jgi:glutathione S-transferase
MLRQRWLEVLRAELVRRDEEEEGGARREQAIAALEAELRAMAERLAGVEGSLLEDASIAQRLAVLTYLPHRLSAAEQKAESAALEAWFEQRFGKGHGDRR